MTRVPIPTACSRLTGGRSLEACNNRPLQLQLQLEQNISHSPRLRVSVYFLWSQTNSRKNATRNSCWPCAVSFDFLTLLNCRIIVCIIYTISVSYLLGHIHGVMTINFDLIKTPKLTCSGQAKVLNCSIKTNKSLRAAVDIAFASFEYLILFIGWP